MTGSRPIPAPTPAFLQQAEALGMVFEDGDLPRLGRFLSLLLHANESVNLTAVRDPDEAWLRLILDSLVLLPWLLASDAKRVADLGPGGGVPGVPLAIVMRCTSFTLVEATGKKATFLEHAVEVLDLADVEVIHDRSETVAALGGSCRERFDAVTARAVGPLSVLVELAMPMLRVGGILLALKGPTATQEVDEAAEAMALLHAGVSAIEPGPRGTVVAVEKLGPTPRRFPRRPGEPRRAPLGGGRGGGS